MATQVHRLDRRIRLLRGKREGAFDHGQYALERAPRGRVAREIRAKLRRLEPVVLITPRWSQAHRFLDDVATDLAIGRPAILARTLSLAPLMGRTVPESWTWLVRAFVEFLGMPVDGPVATAVDRLGFRNVVGGLFRKGTGGPRRALLVHGLEHLHVEACSDLIRAFREHVEEAGQQRKVVVLFAGSVDAPVLDLEGATRLTLPDFSPDEAIDALAEWLGSVDRTRLDVLVASTGGIPAVLDRLGEALGARQIDLPALVADHEMGSQTSPTLWRALGPLGEEIRHAVSVALSVQGGAERLEHVANSRGCAEDPDRDRALLRAGLLSADGHPIRRRVVVRGPLLLGE